MVPYQVASGWQKDLHARRVEGTIPDILLLLEHPHVYTLGSRFDPKHLLIDRKVLAERGIELHKADRGGSITYHGPGQLVGYPIVDLNRGSRGHPTEDPPDAIQYLRRLEEAIIRTVRGYGVIATRRKGLTGVWVGDGKLAAIGVNVSRGITKHGFALNVTTDLSFFDAIVPCGIPDIRATSIEELVGEAPAMEDVRYAVAWNLAKVLHKVPVKGDLRNLGLRLSQETGGGTMPPKSQVIDFPNKKVRAKRAYPSKTARAAGDPESSE